MGYEFSGFLGTHDKPTGTTSMKLAKIARFHLRMAAEYKRRSTKRTRLHEHWLYAARQHEAYAEYLEHQAQEAQLRESP